MKGLWRRALLLGAVASLAVCGSAAAQTTIGALPSATPAANCTGPRDITQLTDTSATYTVPFDGVITSWSTFAAAVDGQRSTLKLVRSVESRQLVRSHDGPRALVPGQVNTFRTSIPVREGEVLALNGGPGESACQFQTGIAGDSTLFTEAGVDTPDGQSFDRFLGDDNFLVNVQATILPPPRLTAISPSAGPVTGGTPVTVSGANLAEVQSVSFSGVPALRFSVANEGQLTAVAPPNAELTSRTIEVKTVAGAASAPRTFDYLGCAVPQLKRGTLAEAKRDLRIAGCKLGKVKRLRKASLRKGKVARQSPAAGKIVPPGTKVSVTLKGRR